MSKAVVLYKLNKRALQMRNEMNRRGESICFLSLDEYAFCEKGFEYPILDVVYGGKKYDVIDKAMAFRNLDIPKEYEIKADYSYRIYDGHIVKGNIYTDETNNMLIVKNIDWVDEQGKVFRRDYYNLYGYHCSTLTLDKNGNNLVQSFIDHDKKEVITHYFEGDLYLIRKNGKEIFAKGREAFEDIVLSYCVRYEKILLANEEVLGRIHIADAYGEGGESKNRKSAFILTVTDDIPGLEFMAKTLTDFEFYVGASTQVSQKLRDMEQLGNVHIFPQISVDDRKKLYKRCSFYLDITRDVEIYNAVYSAQISGLIVIGFEGTVNRKEMMAAENIIADYDTEEMTEKIRKLSADENLYDRCIDSQKRIVAQCLENERLFE